MVLGYFDIAVPRGTDNTAESVVAAIAGVRDPKEIVKRVLAALDRNKDGKLERDEVGDAQKPIFDKLDTNSNGVVTDEEFLVGLPELRKLFRP